ncbi:hypothetical protein SAMN05421736_110130 [Evansella caseinilytica]|uniref:Uncharacterized protein n=1 Tax=Evansella caseinilytica TaxID=1503961 RepID=A0A1H3SD34_9BACI|nr:hypothetical protein SAMN05421736_110130 [Evansella caseinilytica]
MCRFSSICFFRIVEKYVFKKILLFIHTSMNSLDVKKIDAVGIVPGFKGEQPLFVAVVGAYSS